MQFVLVELVQSELYYLTFQQLGPELQTPKSMRMHSMVVYAH